MGRPRKNDTHLPRCVYHRHGAYYLAKKGVWTLLGHTLAEALQEYARRFESPTGGMAALIDEAMPHIIAKASKNTRRQYGYAAKKLKHMLAEFAPEQMQQRHVARVKMNMADTPNSGNTCLTVLRNVFSYAVENQLLDNNPALGIKPFPVSGRERLISHEEFAAIYAVADEQLQIIMDLYYKTGQRVEDVLKIPVADITADGIYFRQQKTKARLCVEWDAELRAIVDRAKKLHGNARALTLLHKRGKPLRAVKIRERWIAACAAAGVVDAQLRDLRAMSATAAEDPQRLLGHTTPKTTENYLRSKKVPLVQGPSFGQVLRIGQKKPANQ